MAEGKHVTAQRVEEEEEDPPCVSGVSQCAGVLVRAIWPVHDGILLV